MTPLPKSPEALAAEVASSPDVHLAVACLARIILAKAAPTARYTAERQLINAVEHAVKAAT